MSASPLLTRRRHKSPSTGWLLRLTSVVLCWTFAASDSWAQSAPGPTDDPESKTVAKAKQRPRILGRWFGDKTPAEAQPASRPAAPIARPPVVSNPPTVPAGLPPVDPNLVRTQGFADTNSYSYQNIANVTPGSESDKGFFGRLIDAYTDEPGDPVPPDPNAPPSRRGFDAPFQAPPMPFADFIGPTIGVNDTSVYPLMDALYRGKNGQAWKDSRIKILGWFDPSYNASTSKNSNIPLSYNIVPNQLELSQVILIFERPVETAQTDHFDWGFRFTNLYGIDFRYTAAKGYFSNQLLKHNHLYGYDPLQMQVDLYMPHIADGTVLRLGRYISPLDIEAQLSPDNFLYTHSNMYSVDPYTFTGAQFTSRLSDQWQIIYGAHCGADMAPWTKSSQPNGEILLKWVSKNNKDSIFGGLDSIGKGYFSNGHDDLQIVGFTWSHKFNDRFTTMTEQYYLWERSALRGGTVTNGTPQPYYEGTGPGILLHGLSDAYGIVNYTSYVLDDKSLLVFRSDVLADFRGWRTGYPGADFENTLGYVRHITPWAILRPEVRFDYTSGQKAYDNGTRREQFTFNMDLILRF
jgi:hypothetical protein